MDVSDEASQNCDILWLPHISVWGLEFKVLSLGLG